MICQAVSKSILVAVISQVFISLLTVSAQRGYPQYPGQRPPTYPQYPPYSPYPRPRPFPTPPPFPYTDLCSVHIGNEESYKLCLQCFMDISEGITTPNANPLPEGLDSCIKTLPSNFQQCSEQPNFQACLQQQMDFHRRANAQNPFMQRPRIPTMDFKEEQWMEQDTAWKNIMNVLRNMSSEDYNKVKTALESCGRESLTGTISRPSVTNPLDRENPDSEMMISPSQMGPQKTGQQQMPQQMNPQQQMLPQMSQQQQMPPQMSQQQQMPPQMSQQQQMPPQMSQQQQMPPQMSQQQQMPPQMNPQQQMPPQMNPQQQMPPQMSQQQEMPPEMNPQQQIMSRQYTPGNPQNYPNYPNPQNYPNQPHYPRYYPPQQPRQPGQNPYYPRPGQRPSTNTVEKQYESVMRKKIRAEKLHSNLLCQVAKLKENPEAMDILNKLMQTYDGNIPAELMRTLKS